MTRAVELSRFSPAKLAEVAPRLQAYLQTFADQRQGEGLEARPRQRQLSTHEPRVDGRQYVCQMTGVALMTIDGLRTGSLTLDLIAEIGLDLHPWPPEEPFRSWRCGCPGHKKTGGGGSAAARAKTPAGRPGSVVRRHMRWRARRPRGAPSIAG